MESARFKLVKGCDPPVVHSGHKTDGDVWRGPIKLLLKNTLRLVRAKRRQKFSIALG